MHVRNNNVSKSSPDDPESMTCLALPSARDISRPGAMGRAFLLFIYVLMGKQSAVVNRWEPEDTLSTHHVGPVVTA